MTPQTAYLALGLAILALVRVARNAGLPARYGAIAAVALGALAAGADALVLGRPWPEAVIACLASAAGAVTTHELGEAARGRYAPTAEPPGDA